MTVTFTQKDIDIQENNLNISQKALYFIYLFTTMVFHYVISQICDSTTINKGRIDNLCLPSDRSDSVVFLFNYDTFAEID